LDCIQPGAFLRKGGLFKKLSGEFCNFGNLTVHPPTRTQWQIRYAFNGFCKRTLKNEASNAHRGTKRQQLREVTFSDLTPQEENQFYTLNSYFTDDKAEQSFFVAGKEITARQVADVLHLLPEDKRKAVLLYCFFEMSNVIEKCFLCHSVPI
jgi:hypothetical protein